MPQAVDQSHARSHDKNNEQLDTKRTQIIIVSSKIIHSMKKILATYIGQLLQKNTFQMQSVLNVFQYCSFLYPTSCGVCGGILPLCLRWDCAVRFGVPPHSFDLGSLPRRPVWGGQERNAVVRFDCPWFPLLPSKRCQLSDNCKDLLFRKQLWSILPASCVCYRVSFIVFAVKYFNTSFFFL